MKPNILLIDDERSFQDKIKRRFESEYNWVSAYSANGLHEALANPALEIDMAFLDLQLSPNGSNDDFEGIDLKMELKKHEIPFMVLTKSRLTPNLIKEFTQNGVQVIGKDWLARESNRNNFIKKIEVHRKRKRIVSIYSGHKEDHRWYIDFTIQLFDLEKKGWLWSEDGNRRNDPGLLPGGDIEDQRRKQLKEAGMILLFLSADLVASERFEQCSEIFKTIQEASRARRTVIPILLRPVWNQVSFGDIDISQLASLPANREWAENRVKHVGRDAVLKEIADGVRKLYHNRMLK